MPIQMINIGRLANDGTGDDLREAFIKINQNFQELEDIRNTSGVNLGSAGAEVFVETIDSVLQFRRLVAGNNVEITQLDNTVQISSDAPPPTNFLITGDNSSSLSVTDGTILTITGTPYITTLASENNKSVRFELTSQITQYLSFDFGGITPSANSIFDVIMNSVDVDFGTVTDPNDLSVDIGTIV